MILKSRKYKKKGFIGMVDVALALFAFVIILTIAQPNFMGIFNNSKQETAINDCRLIGTAISQYHYDTGEYPDVSDLSEANKDSSKLTKAGTGKQDGYGPWLQSLKHDPWGQDYQLVTGDNSFVVYSLGPTGAPEKVPTADTLPTGVLGFLGR